MTARTAVFGSLAPVAGAGVLLLLAGAVLLLIGGLWLSTDPATLSLWTVLMGLVILIGAMALLLWLEPAPAAPWDESVRTPAPARPRVRASQPRGAAVAPALRFPPANAARSVERAVAMRADLPRGAARSARAAAPTSIPGAYLQSLGAAGTRVADDWRVVPPPMAAALPFSPAIQPLSDTSPPWLESDESTHEEPKLELELARLRARVRELEKHPAPVGATRIPAGAALSFAPSGAGVPEPPAPPNSAVLGRRACAGCGSGVESSGPAVLCWGCGRALCASCYWRFGPGPGLHRCPDCLARSPADPLAISGGRAGVAPTASLSATPSASSAPTPTSH
ncbi:MAG TPA: hypothetical protein VIZ68_03675 [Thermoplasmata archaeon]